MACLTDSRGVKESLNKVKEIFVANGYPKKFVESVIGNTRNNRQRKQTEIDSDKLVNVKLPYINEDYRRRALSVIRRSGVDNVKACFIKANHCLKCFQLPKVKLSAQISVRRAKVLKI